MSVISNLYIYENLKHICDFNENTGLYMYEPTYKLYVVKKIDLSTKIIYDEIKKLNNPHLAKILFVVEKDGYAEVVREYISGDKLADLLNKSRMSQERATSICIDICEGLEAMHEIGCVHRDINPNNIIISTNGCAVIIDYNISRSFFQNKNFDTVILGTPGYAAPEQFGFSQSDARTDIYAIGVLLNVMITGNLPGIQLSDGRIGKIIEKCVEIDSKNRFNDIRELKAALRGNFSSENVVDRIIKNIPGIRSPHIFTVIFSVIGYLMMIMMTVSAFATVKNNAYIQLVVSWIFSTVIPFFCFHNFLDIWNKIPLLKGAEKRNKKIVYILLGIISLIIGLYIFGNISA